jgi:ArsR family transcriptional regulator, arsenate/arsenite/antimonite-responsive transcriptional repressor / arsenate reductase (thioredoxin)
LIYSRRVVAVRPIEGPPVVLRLVGHPLRWRLLRELAHSDRQVRELRALVGEPQSLVSYHLGQLRVAGLVRAQRSSFDGRHTYYSIDLPRCAESLANAGGALHPGLGLVAAPPEHGGRRRSAARTRVLFLCTGNSARSQMAEALVGRRAGDGVVAVSAGSAPKPMHPNTVRVMRAYGIDVAGRPSKHVSEFAGRRLDYVISLCDRVREVCPSFAGPPQTIHWSIPDPTREGDSDTDTLAAFERTAAELDTRIGFLMQQIHNTHDTRR